MTGHPSPRRSSGGAEHPPSYPKAGRGVEIEAPRRRDPAATRAPVDRVQSPGRRPPTAAHRGRLRAGGSLAVTTGADVLVEGLAHLGVRHVFGMPGSHSTSLYDALAR